jgi:hypothetical protein
MMPTPTSRDHKDTGVCVTNGAVPVNSLLGRHVQMFPTPTQFDATCGDLKGKEYTGENRHAMKLIQAVGSDGTDAHPSTPSGSLNPRWVGWLMGFPDGWTNLEP